MSKYIELTDEQISSIKRDAKRNRHVRGQGPSVLAGQAIIEVKYHSTTEQGNNRRTITTADGYKFVTKANSHAGLDAENYDGVTVFRDGEYHEYFALVDIELNGWGCVTGIKGPNKQQLRDMIDSES